MNIEEHAALDAAVDEIAELLGTKLSFGYIGNIWYGPYEDDRSWYVWFKDLPRGIQTHLNNPPSVHVGTAKHGFIDEATLRRRLISTFYRMQATIEGRGDLIGFRYALNPRFLR